jgi:hypothetical protein
MFMSNNNEIKNNVEVKPTYNIYTKLQKLRKDFHSVDLKKSGENKYAGFKYLELADFLPLTVNLLEKYNMTTIMTTNNEGASLVLVDCDNPDSTITFFIPDADCQLKGCTDIQSLGGKITYQKRYLYLQLTDACVPDLLDNVTGKDTVKSSANTNTYKLSENQINRLFVLGKKIGLTEKQVRAQVSGVIKKEVEDLNKEEYDRVCTGYISKAGTNNN